MKTPIPKIGRPAFKHLLLSLKTEPELWEIMGDNSLYHYKAKVRIGIERGRKNYKILLPRTILFSYWQRWALHFALKRWFKSRAATIDKALDIIKNVSGMADWRHEREPDPVAPGLLPGGGATYTPNQIGPSYIPPRAGATPVPLPLPLQGVLRNWNQNNVLP